MSLDMAQVCFDLAGIVDPTPVCEGISTLISIARGDWLNAALSGASMVPFIGDLAKVGKLAKDIRIVERAIELAGKSDKAAELLTPILQKLARLMDLFPANPGAEFTRLRQMTNDFLRENRVAKTVTGQLPDIRAQFKFSKYERNGNIYQEASGNLGVPGKVLEHRSSYAQTKLTGGTGDDAGHLIGNRFGAPGTAENLGPQNFIQNQYGTFKKLENDWAIKLNNGTGIKVTVRDVYRKGEDRPFMRQVEWTETSPSGLVTKNKLDFANTQTPKSRFQQGIQATVPPGTNADVIDMFTRQRLN
jgi:hypothetical protein